MSLQKKKVFLCSTLGVATVHPYSVKRAAFSPSEGSKNNSAGLAKSVFQGIKYRLR